MCGGVVAGFFFFFFQAEDGIRDYKVTGVQTCALPISPLGSRPGGRRARAGGRGPRDHRGRRAGGRRVRRRSEERRVGKSVDLGGRRIIKKKKRNSEGLGDEGERTKCVANQEERREGRS